MENKTHSDLNEDYNKDFLSSIENLSSIVEELIRNKKNIIETEKNNEIKTNEVKTNEVK